MISFQMEDVKAFMNKLLLSQTFDAFHVVEGSVITYSTFHFDGHLHPDYYTKEEQEALGLESRRFARWPELRPFCLELIKGKRTPLGFRFILSALAGKYGEIVKPDRLPIFHRGCERPGFKYPL